jgi:hypothetical protein
MGFERRLFTRTDVEIQGTLRWAVKRRLRGVKQHEVPMMTVDLSVNGAKILVADSVDLPVGASCRIMFSDESSPARVRKVTTNGTDHKMLSMQLEEPPLGFMRVIDQWLDASAGGRKFEETSWFAEGSSTTSSPTRSTRR